MRNRLTTCLLVLGAVAMPIAADNGAWFGTPVPPPVSDPRRPVMKHDDVFGPLPAQFAHRPGRHDELLDGAVLKTDHKKIVGFSLESLNAGDKVWGRRAATPAFMHTLEWTVNEFKVAGLKDAKVETFVVSAPMWVPQSWQVQLVGDPAFGAGTQTVTLTLRFPSRAARRFLAAASRRQSCSSDAAPTQICRDATSKAGLPWCTFARSRRSLDRRSRASPQSWWRRAPSA